jgi:hypothetical protein
MRAEDSRRAISIWEEEERVVADATTTTERYAQAIERLNKLRDLGFMTSLDKPGSMGIDRTLPELNQDYPEGDLRRQLMPSGAKDFAPLPVVAPEDPTTVWDYWTAMQTQSFNEAMVSFGENVRQGFASTLSDSIRDALTEGFSERRTGASGMKLFFDRMRNMVGEQLAGLGGTIIDYGSRYVLKGLGRLFQKVGLTMGLVAIAVGVALSALAGSISTAAKGGDTGFSGGAIGGLDVGGKATGPQTYTFTGERGRAVSGSRAYGSENLTVNFNGPIIGPNDLSAQRAIGDIVKNAKRRGLA